MIHLTTFAKNLPLEGADNHAATIHTAATDQADCLNLGTKMPQRNGAKNDNFYIATEKSNMSVLYHSHEQLDSSHADELRQSAISKEFQEYFGSVDGNELFDRFTTRLIENVGGHGQQYATAPIRRVRERYKHLLNGGWICDSFLNPLNDWAVHRDFFVAKPNVPRIDRIRNRPIKYESPQGLSSRAMFLGDADEWREILDSKTPITIVEGVKKLACLMSHGFAGVGLTGVWNGTPKNDAGTPELLPELALIAKGRRIYIAFDQDTKPKTRKKVARATARLAKHLKLAGADVFIVSWDSRLGKGPDDLIFNHGVEAFEEALKSAKSNAQRVRDAARSEYRRLSEEAKPHRTINSRYIPPMTFPSGAFVAIASPVGTGKTTFFLDQLKAATGWRIILSHQNSLVKQTANLAKIDHIHALDRQDIENAVRGGSDGSFAGAINSLHRIDPDSVPEGSVLILDEVQAVLETLFEGNTLQGKHAETIGLLRDLIRNVLNRGGRVFCGEDSLTRLGIEALTWLVGREPEVIKNEWLPEPSEISIVAGNRPGFFAYSILMKLYQGKRIEVSTTSQIFGERLEKFVRQFFPDLDILRYDQTTKDDLGEFARNPQKFLEDRRPNLLIYSPSAGFGMSWYGKDIFDERFANLGYLPSRTGIQLPARDRSDLPLTIFTTENAFDPSSPGVFWQTIAKGAKVNCEAAARFSGWLSSADESQVNSYQGDMAEGSESERITEFYAKFKAAAEYSRSNLLECLTEHYEGRGHTIRLFGCSDLTPDIKEVWRQSRIEVEEERAKRFAEATPVFSDRQSAQICLASGQSTYQRRVEAQKYLLMDDVPTEQWNDEWFVHRARIANNGRLLRCAKKLWIALNPDVAREFDRKSIEAQSGNRVIIRHRVSKNFQESTLIQILKIVDVAKLEIYSENTQAIQELKRTALHYKGDIYRLWRLTINEKQTGIQIANKLLRKVGFEPAQQGRKGGMGNQERLWRVTNLNCAIRAEIFKALDTKHSRGLATTRILINHQNTGCDYGPKIDESPHEKRGDRLQFETDQPKGAA